MAETSTDDQATTIGSAALPRKKIVTLFRLFLAAIALGFGLGALLWHDAQQAKAEQEAKAAIDALHGLTVLDAAQKHVVSLNLQLIKGEQAIRTAMQSVSKLPYLQILDLSHTSVTDSEMTAVSSLRNLNSLHLNGTLVTDACVRDIASLSKLQGLHLAGTAITSRSYEQIPQLDNLIHLDLSGTAVGPEIRQLATMKKLKWLLLREVALPPTLLAALAHFTELKRLTVDLQQSKSPQIATLREQLPNLTID